MSGDDVGRGESTVDDWRLSVDSGKEILLPNMNNVTGMATNTDSLHCRVNEQFPKWPVACKLNVAHFWYCHLENLHRRKRLIFYFFTALWDSANQASLSNQWSGVDGSADQKWSPPVWRWWAISYLRLGRPSRVVDCGQTQADVWV